MADILKGLFGGAKSAVSSVSSDGDDFADFATAASPEPPSHAASSAFSATNTASGGFAGTAASLFGTPLNTANRPYTKWYRIWERVTIHDFYQELFLIPILLVIIAVNLIGSAMNKSRAKQWATTYLPLIDAEFASVGFGGGKKRPSANDVQSQGLAKAIASSQDIPQELLKQKQKNEYLTYATGRQNVAFLHVQISLYKRYNPLIWFGEAALSFFFDSVTAPAERVEATLYPFDGKEKTFVQNPEGAVKDSSYDNFVWAIVHKDKMKQLRDDRYDLSLTATRDNAKLPDFVSVMTESAEISDVLLTPELIKAVTDAGEDLEALIITEQPIDAPKKLNDMVPNKRISLSMRLNTTPTSTSLFQYFLRLPDILVQTGRFRSEALRKIKQTRDEEQRKIKKVDEEEKAEERKLQGDKMKKEVREKKLNSMSAEEQKKFLERESEQERKKGMKKKTQRA